MARKESREGLPETVRSRLPSHARHIYKEAHDNAVNEYKDPEDRRGGASLEQTAHKVAWAAVKQKYRKNRQGEWVEKKNRNATFETQ